MKDETRRWLVWIGLYAVTVAVCFGLGHWDRIGADCYFFADFVAAPGLRCFYRSALTVFIHKFVYLLAHPFGVPSWYAVALSSSLAGAGYLWVLFRFSRSPIFWIVNLSAGSVWVFFGHVENYAWVSFFLILSLYELREYEEGRQPLWKSFACYFLAVASHQLALFYVPGYLYFLRGQSLKERERLEILIPLISCIAFFIIVPLLVPTVGTDLGFQRLVPWISPWAKNQYFTLFSSDHFRMLVFFHRVAAPFGVPFLAFVLIGLYSWRLSSRFLKSLLVMSGCGVIWTTFWHPDWGYRDWDLFSQFGLVANLLAGLLLVHEKPQGQSFTQESFRQEPRAEDRHSYEPALNPKGCDIPHPQQSPCECRPNIRQADSRNEIKALNDYLELSSESVTFRVQ